MKCKLFTFFLLIFISCTKNSTINVDEKESFPKTIGHAIAVIDNGDTIDFPYVQKNGYSELNENKRRGSLYVAYKSNKDTLSSSEQVAFAISNQQSLDFITYIKPIGINVGSEYSIYNKEFVKINYNGELNYQFENNFKDSTTIIANGYISSLNINYARLTYSKKE